MYRTFQATETNSDSSSVSRAAGDDSRQEERCPTEMRADELTSQQDDRALRYINPNAVEEMCKSKNINELRPFYKGDQVNERMNAIRDNIVFIRHNWKNRQQFFRDMQQFIEENKKEFGGGDKFSERIDKLGLRSWEWGDLHPETLDENFDAVRLYTSADGYKCIFGIINAVFRQDDAVQFADKIRNAVFLVELINIDLFNYCLKFPEHNNFQGTVYRGLGLTSEDFKAFTSLLERPVPDRYIAVPLGLWSATSDINVAVDFIEKCSDDKIPVIMRIDVIEVKPEYLDYYRKTYPSSVVSTICAVDIHALSDYPHEAEVILRGSFCQALRLHKGQLVLGRTCHILDCVTINVNRDHMSTAFLGEQDAPARELFRHMVAATRCSFALNYCEENGVLQDVEHYKKLLESAEKTLQTLMK